MMKRTLSLVLLILFIISFSACHYSKGSEILEPVNFYYPRKTAEFVYGAADGVITAEVREASGHSDDLDYLLTMYLRGPQDENLRSPFPSDCKLEEIYTDDDTLYIRLSSEFGALAGTELTIACAAITKTCLSMTDLPYICIETSSQGKSVQMVLDADSLLFADQSAFEPQSTAE